MASGSKSKQRRREGVPVPPVSSTGRARRASPRVLAGAGAALAAIVVAVVLAVVLSGGSSAPNNVPAVGSLAGALPGAAAVERLYRGIPQAGVRLGAASAPATMVEYVDLQCPYCAQFEMEVFPDVVERYVRTGKLRVVLRPWAFIGPDSVRGQAAVLAAGLQDRAFNFASLLYANQGAENTGWLDEDMVAATAASIPGLRVPQLLDDLSSPEVAAQARQVAADVQADGVTATPTIFVGKTGSHGTKVELTAPDDEATLVKAIDAALAG